MIAAWGGLLSWTVKTAALSNLKRAGKNEY